MDLKPALIAFEGIDGVGKTTHLEATSQFLSSLLVPNLATQELGGTDIGRKCREILMQNIDPIEELLTISLARRWHFRNLVLPSLEQGKVVLMDRFIESTWAYQVGGNGLNPEIASFFGERVWGTREPELTVYIKGPSHRLSRDRFETAGQSFFNKVTDMYNSRIAKNWLVLSSENSFKENQYSIESFLRKNLPALSQ
jgi:dTMP kinase